MFLINFFSCSRYNGTVICSHVNKVRSEHIFIPLVPWQTDEQKKLLALPPPSAPFSLNILTGRPVDNPVQS